jgi:SAM-dependent methyltransferase
MMIYDSIGDAYDLVYPDTHERVPFVTDLLKKHGKNSLLELGIGTGLFAIPLHEAGFDVEGLEISQVMIDVVTSRAPGLAVHLGDMRDFTINNKYDAILALSSVLVFVANEPEIKQCLQRCHEHLEPGGVLLLELPNHPVEIWHSNNSQEMHQNQDQSTVVVIQSAVEGQDWNETWHVFRNNKAGLSYQEAVCQEFLYSPEALSKQLDDVGFDVLETAGDLLGNPFEEATSWRRVLVCGKRT